MTQHLNRFILAYFIVNSMLECWAVSPDEEKKAMLEKLISNHHKTQKELSLPLPNVPVSTAGELLSQPLEPTAQPIGSPSSQVGSKRGNSKLTVRDKESTTVTGECVVEVIVDGGGVNHIFHEPCLGDGMLINTDRGIVYGDVSLYSFCLFSDSASTLVIIRDGKCTQLTQKVENGVSSEIQPVSLPLFECADVKRKITEEVEKIENEGDEVDPSTPKMYKRVGKQSSPPLNQQTIGKKTNGVNSPRMFVHNSRSFFSFIRCKLNINALGNGVSDTFQVPCSKYHSTGLNMPKFVVDGDTTFYSFCLYHETAKPGTLVVIREGKCTKNVYTTSADGKTSKQPQSLSNEECNEVGHKISHELQRRGKYWEGWEKNVEKLSKTSNENQQKSPVLGGVKSLGGGKLQGLFGGFFSP